MKEEKERENETNEMIKALHENKKKAQEKERKEKKRIIAQKRKERKRKFLIKALLSTPIIIDLVYVFIKMFVNGYKLTYTGIMITIIEIILLNLIIEK